MSAQRTAAENILKHYFQNLAHANVGDASGLQPSAAAGSLYVSLHTADPGETGDQTSNEIAYTGYARVAVGRASGNWAVSSGVSPAVADNVAAVTFGQCTAGSGTATHFGIGTAASGAGVLLFSGALTASLAISAGITPEFAAGDANITLE